MLRKFTKLVETDWADPTRLNLLNLTLNPLSKAQSLSKFSKGDLVPFGWHLCLFPNYFTEAELAKDGYDTTFSPPEPYLKRMWAGGSFHFIKDNPLLVGQRVEQTTVLDRIQEKKTDSNHILFVWLKKSTENEHGLCVSESRCLAYMTCTSSAKTSATKSRQYDIKESIVPSPIMLFRYSALTFNSHLIHYNQDFSRNHENYPDCLVHGPLTCTLLLELLSKHYPGAFLKSFEYRAVSPLLLNEKIDLCASQLSDPRQVSLVALNSNGKVAMKGTASLY